ncbi:MAG: CCA tRNA nucleotidyltransferase [Pseudomonadota bacterium]
MATNQRLAAPWLSRPQLHAVFSALGHENCRLVGGCVRDGLLGLPVSDIDIATTLVPTSVIGASQAVGIKAIPTGIDHGTVTLVVDGVPFEVTTLRRDVATDGRRAVVDFAADWQMDAARRDFTINALYATLQGAVSDYFGGLPDLDAKRVRFIGDAQTRIEEDALRILRFYRFSARFSETLDQDGRAACRQKSAMIKSLSRERIAAEWFKMLGHDHPQQTLEAMADDGIIGAFLPEADMPALLQVIEREKQLGLAPDGLRRFAALLPKNKAKVEAAARRLKLSNAVRKDLAARAQAARSQEPAAALYYRYGFQAGRDGLIMSGKMPSHGGGDWQRPVFPVRAADLQSKTKLEGKALGKALHTLEEDWISSEFTLSKEDLIARAADL